jgi:hypothetical protein
MPNAQTQKPAAKPAAPVQKPSAAAKPAAKPGQAAVKPGASSYAAAKAALQPKPAAADPTLRPGGYSEPSKKKKKKPQANGQNQAGVQPTTQPAPAQADVAKPAAKPLSPLQDPSKNPDPTNEYAPNATYGEVKGVVAAKGQDDAHEIDPNDVEQGALGDCYFVAQLAAQAKTNPGRIKDLIKDNGNNTFTVTLHLKDPANPYKRVATPIVVDAQFPQKDGGVAYAKPGDRGNTGPELWVMLIEKAFAKHSGSYELIRGSKTRDGDVFGMMSGTNSGSISLGLGADLLLQKLSAALTNGQAISFGAKSKNTADEALQGEAKTAGVVLNHAYSLLGVDAKARTVDLRNPWGVRHLMGFSVDNLKKFYDSCDVAAK